MNKSLNKPFKLPITRKSSVDSSVRDVNQQILPYISSINPRDNILLKEAVAKFKPDSINYEDSWGYILQATRYHGFKWYDPSKGTLIFFGKKSNKDATLVIPNFFAPPDYLQSVINKLQNSLGVEKTILKNVSPIDVPVLARYGFRPYKKSEYWDKNSRFDDQTYPQIIIDLEKLFNAQGRPYHPLRKALNKTNDLILRKYSDSDKDEVLKIFSLKDSDENKDTNPSGIYYESHSMYPSSNTDRFTIIDKTTNEILGFTATSDISSVATAFVASVFKSGRKHIGTWGMYTTLMSKYHEGFHVANMGGSESSSTFNFKNEKFQPIAKLEKNHLVYEPDKSADSLMD